MADAEGVLLSLRFNPTLVRLRQLRQRANRSSSTLFQSHAGSIEAMNKKEMIEVTLACFNPTLVRLRPSRWRTRWLFTLPFQSHAGSIEARGMGSRTASPGCVSIPRWFD